MPKVILFLILLPLTGFSQHRWTDFVNPFVGTAGHGHTFPGATLPFGMVQLSPDTRLEGWDGCSGYHYDDDRIYGFSHTHLSGTGVSDYGDILLKPMSRPPDFDREVYASGFSHDREEARPGYYAVFLKEDQIQAELTATTRVGVHRYTYPVGGAQHLMLDLEHRDEVLEAHLEVVSSTRIRGMRRSKAWAEDQVVYFDMEFSRPLTNWYVRHHGQVEQRVQRSVSGKDIIAALTFDSRDEPLIIKVGISSVDAEGAALNLRTECPGFDFDLVRETADAVWNDHLGRIEAEGRNQDHLRTFYTSLYHCMIHPSTASDVDGRYRGMDKKIHRAQGYTHYTIFSLWDTYRALHPLLTILDKERTNHFVRSMLAMYQQSGRLPVWELAANETNCMIGYHAVSVILDAYVKNIRDWDHNLALEAMVQTARAPLFGLPAYMKKGYLEIEDESESVSKTLEYAYNDWCIAEMARLKRKQPIYEEFLERSIGYRHLLDRKTGFIRPRSNGGWLEPFDPREVTNHYTEANGWQYTFYAPHDLEYLVEGMGGKVAFERKLDQFFESPSTITGREQADITGLIGQYAQGNEPSHHAAYLYAFSPSPWKTQKWVDQIMALYTPEPDGLPGNEDCGQMSAWYVFSAMGMYPVTPGNNTLLFGTPLFERVRIQIGDEGWFEILSDRRRADQRYINEVYMNNELWTAAWIPYHFIGKDVTLDFRMSTTYNKNYGTYQFAQPKSKVVWPGFVQVPALAGPQVPFRNQGEVTILAQEANQRLLYSTDGKAPSRKYEDPLSLGRTTTVRALSIDTAGNQSPAVTGTFYLLPHNWSIEVHSTVHPQYTGGGPDALIDGLHGDTDWRKGRWHGYQGVDLDLTVDLGKNTRINEVGGSFLQDTRAWIVLPREVKVSVSRDGRTFKEAARIRHNRPIRTEEAFTRRLTAKSKVKRGRYVRLQAVRSGPLPDWHPGAGGESYIFIDEVIID
jgi:predicted alpha-1,2-mannosidase